MEHRPLSLAACLILLALPAFAVPADEELGSAEQRADWAQRLDQAKVLAGEGKSRRAAAAKIRKDKDAECPKRFQVNACLKENQNEYMLVERQADRLENDGLAIERGVRKEQLQLKDARHEADSARRAAELPGREAETAAVRQEATTREADNRAAKARKAEAGEQRKAAAAENLRQRQAAHAARVAEKMKKAQAQPESSATPGK
jgi:colicin import membrane protein